MINTKKENPNSAMMILRNIIILFLAYYIPGQLGFFLSPEPDHSAAIWPSSGFAAAGVILLGYSSLPGVFLGAFMLYLHYQLPFLDIFSSSSFEYFAIASWVALGAFVEALFVAFVVKKLIGFPNSLSYWQDILILFLVGGLLGAIPAPTIGVAAMYFIGDLNIFNCLYVWLTWWVGSSMGLVTIMPIILTIFSSAKCIGRRRKLFITIPLALIFVVISSVFLFTNSYEKSKLQKILEYETKDATSLFTANIIKHIRDIVALESFYKASDLVSGKDFHDFVGNFIDYSGALHFVEWMPRVSADDKSTFTWKSLAEGVKDFAIVEYNDEKKVQEVSDRKEYYPSLYAHPDKNREQLGLDALSIPAKREAMSLAINTGKFAVTTIDRTIEAGKNIATFTVFQPIFERGVKVDTTEKRQKHIVGFVAGTFKIHNLFVDFITTMKKQGIEVTIRDNTNGDNRIIFQSAKGNPKYELESYQPLRATNRIWDIQFQQKKAYIIATKKWYLFYLLIGGLIFGVLATILTFMITGYSETIHKLVQIKTVELENNKTRLQLAVTGSKVGIWDWPNITTEDQYWSPEFIKLLGYQIGKIKTTKSSFKELIHPDDIPLMEKSFNPFVDDKISFDVEHRMKMQSGKYRWFQSRGIITTQSNTGIKRMTGSISDIQIQKQTEKTLHQAKEAAESATKMKSDFLATVSHEIRTPMNGIIGITELVLDTDLTKQQKAYLNNVLYSAENLLEILNDILDFSKIEAGKMELEMVPFNLKDSAQEAVDLLLPKAKQKHIQLNFNYMPGTNEYLIGDPIRIRQILHNLVGNAIKFTEQGVVTIAISEQESSLASKDKAMILVSVRDTGIGLTKGQRLNIFNKFTQADSSTTRKFGGTGLGLAICQMLVSMIGGEIGVESESGRGSNFFFTMLLDISSKEDIKDKVKTVSIAELSKELVESKVLMAEDNRINAEFAKEMLEKLKCEVTVVRNGQEAVEMLKTNRNFDLVFMDCQMPIMDGFEATKNICAYEKEHDIKHIPIIALTANAMKGDRDKCLASGMDDYLSKPVRQKDFANKIVQWHGKK